MIVTLDKEVIAIPSKLQGIEVYLQQKDIVKYKDEEYIVLGKYLDVGKTDVGMSVLVEEKSKWIARLGNQAMPPADAKGSEAIPEVVTETK